MKIVSVNWNRVMPLNATDIAVSLHCNHKKSLLNWGEKKRNNQYCFTDSNILHIRLHRLPSLEQSIWHRIMANFPFYIVIYFFRRMSQSTVASDMSFSSATRTETSAWLECCPLDINRAVLVPQKMAWSGPGSMLLPQIALDFSMLDESSPDDPPISNLSVASDRSHWKKKAYSYSIGMTDRRRKNLPWVMLI